MGTNILRAIGDSKRPLYFLIAASLVNIVLDVVFIAVFGSGRGGRGVGHGAKSGRQRGADAAVHRRLPGNALAHPGPQKLRLHTHVLAAMSPPSGVPGCGPERHVQRQQHAHPEQHEQLRHQHDCGVGCLRQDRLCVLDDDQLAGHRHHDLCGAELWCAAVRPRARGVRVCLAMAAGVTLVISVVFYNLAEPLFRLFSQDDAVIAVGVGMMHVLTPVYITYMHRGAFRCAARLRRCARADADHGVFCLWPACAVADPDGAVRYRHEVATVEFELPPHLDAGLRCCLSFTTSAAAVLPGGVIKPPHLAGCQRCAERGLDPAAAVGRPPYTLQTIRRAG